MLPERILPQTQPSTMETPFRNAVPEQEIIALMQTLPIPITITQEVREQVLTTPYYEH